MNEKKDIGQYPYNHSYHCSSIWLLHIPDVAYAQYDDGRCGYDRRTSVPQYGGKFHRWRDLHCFGRRAFFNFDGFSPGKSHDTDPNLFLRFLKNLGRNIRATGLYFLVGVLLSALFQRYVPADAFAELFGKENEGFGLLLASPWVQWLHGGHSSIVWIISGILCLPAAALHQTANIWRP